MQYDAATVWQWGPLCWCRDNADHERRSFSYRDYEGITLTFCISSQLILCVLCSGWTRAAIKKVLCHTTPLSKRNKNLIFIVDESVDHFCDWSVSCLVYKMSCFVRWKLSMVPWSDFIPFPSVCGNFKGAICKNFKWKHSKLKMVDRMWTVATVQTTSWLHG